MQKLVSIRKWNRQIPMDLNSFKGDVKMVQKSNEVTTEQQLDAMFNKLKIDLEYAQKCAGEDEFFSSKKQIYADVIDTLKLLLDSLNCKQYVEIAGLIAKYSGMIGGLLPSNLFALTGKSKG